MSGRPKRRPNAASSSSARLADVGGGGDGGIVMPGGEGDGDDDVANVERVNDLVAHNVSAQNEANQGDAEEEDYEEERMRRRLAFFFMNPVEKYRARKQTPWKLIMQFLKVVFVTTQLVVFGTYRYNHTKYYANNQIAFEHILLKGWDAVREIHAYPPATGAYAIYKKESFYEFFDSVADTYSHLESDTVNPVFRSSEFNYCVSKFSNGTVLSNLTWTIDFKNLTPSTECIIISDEVLANNFSSHKYLEEKDFEVPWDTLQWMSMNFTVKSLAYLQLGPSFGPECFDFHVEILFDNKDYDGQIPVSLKLHPHRHRCPKPHVPHNAKSTTIRLLDFFVILTCLLSLVLCFRALVRAQQLRMEAEDFFGRKFGWELTAAEKLDFLNGWYIVICTNDILIIIGSIIKLLIEGRNTFGDLWDFCSLFLGCGNLLVWIGMLRYLGFFKNYNVLILTMKGALPNCLRFLFCAILIYCGFVFCGWVVLGPYHFKFKSVMSTSECLFSLVNGDDMFATFSSLGSDRMVITVFCRIYLYVFISLFIYVILSLFIAIIMDVYEIIKDFYRDGWPKRRMHEFYLKARYCPRSGIFRNEGSGIRRTMSRVFFGEPSSEGGGGGGGGFGRSTSAENLIS